MMRKVTTNKVCFAEYCFASLNSLGLRFLFFIVLLQLSFLVSCLSLVVLPFSYDISFLWVWCCRSLCPMVGALLAFCSAVSILLPFHPKFLMVGTPDLLFCCFRSASVNLLRLLLLVSLITVVVSLM
jgi:hypothetical protein